MKKKIAFEKKIEFPTMIGEIRTISLEHSLKFIDESNIEGDFLLSGKYKMTEASRLEEDYEYKIPVEISLSEKLDLNTTKVEISDFTYKIENESTMVCNIELSIEGIEKLEIVKEEAPRECDGDPVIEKEIEIPTIEKEEPVEEVFQEHTKSTDTNNLFANIKDDEDTFGTFIVYIVRQNESINDIIEKYHVSLEEVEKYNDIKNIEIGSKLIIPLPHD